MRIFGGKFWCNCDSHQHIRDRQARNPIVCVRNVTSHLTSRVECTCDKMWLVVINAKECWRQPKLLYDSTRKACRPSIAFTQKFVNRYSTCSWTTPTAGIVCIEVLRHHVWGFLIVHLYSLSFVHDLERNRCREYSGRIYSISTTGDEASRSHSADYLGICGPREVRLLSSTN